MKNCFLWMICLLVLVTSSCKKKDSPPTLPELTTAAITNINPPVANGGGSITSNGGRNITVSGICWSKTNQTPTISDDTAKTASATGSFTVNLQNIEPSSTYYVRAYAINEVGTGYGNVVTFTTGNGGPEARNIEIAGTVEVASLLRASYEYFDFENDASGDTTIQWYRADDASGTGEVAIADATTLEYRLQPADEFKYIRIGVVSKAVTGTTQGLEYKSAFVGAIAEGGSSITFNYNGSEVTYGILTSSVTGRKWLDRNLGAANAPTAYNDWANYGDLFQWGRGADGHQLIIRSGGVDANVSGATTTTTLSTTDNPNHSMYILNNTLPPNDWRNPSNDNLWQGVDGINNPCPGGFRVPTRNEIIAENITDLIVGYNQLKLTASGERQCPFGDFFNAGYVGQYWSSSVNAATGNARFYSIEIDFAYGSSYPKAMAMSCRCIKD